MPLPEEGSTVQPVSVPATLCPHRESMAQIKNAASQGCPLNDIAISEMCIVERVLCVLISKIVAFKL